MHHVPNDLRGKKSAEFITEGLYKSLREKPLNSVRVNDIYLTTNVSRSTFYRLFDSVYDVLLYQCDLIVSEIQELVSTKTFESKREMGLQCVKLWLKHDDLVKAMVENNLYGLIYESIMSHKEGLKILYNIDYQDNPQLHYFVYYLVSLIFTSFAIFYKEKGKKSIEEVIESTTQMMMSITVAWGINQ